MPTGPALRPRPRGGAPLDRLRARIGPSLRRKPGFLVIGAQKAGTTSLHNYLASHPRLCPADGPKELHFFDMYHDRGLGWYLSHFPRRLPADRRLWFESTPDYLHHPEAAARIRDDLGRVRMVAVLREPAARALSAWTMWHRFATLRPDEAAKADPRPFAEAIAEELDAPDGSADRHHHYVSAGHYAAHLDRFRALFPERDLLVLDHGLMSRDLGAFLDRICGFLGIPPFPPDEVARLGRQRHWTSPPRDMDDATQTAMERLRAHFAPWNARLFESIGERWDW